MDGCSDCRATEVEMNRLCCALLYLGCATILCAPGQQQANAFVQSFYRQVVAREDYGVPRGAKWKIFAPYLSKGLRRKMELEEDCAKDYSRQYVANPPWPDQKAPFPDEVGLFTGHADLAQKPTFKVERVEAKQNGTFLVYVSLTKRWPSPDKPENWEVVARVAWEAGHPVIDEVTYLKGGDQSFEWKISGYLAVPGCVGPRWLAGIRH
jgi:hypothetical protein